MFVRLLLLGVLFFPIFCNAMDDDFKGKKELIPLMQSIHKSNNKSILEQKIRNIERDEHILFIPLKDIRCSFEALSLNKQRQIKKRLTDCLLFYVGLLPAELQRQVIMYAVDHHEKAANKFLCMPLIQVYERYDEIRKYGSVEIGRKISEQELFSCTKEQRSELLRIARPSLVAQVNRTK